VFRIYCFILEGEQKQRQTLKHLPTVSLGTKVHIFWLCFLTYTFSQCWYLKLLSPASCSEPMWDFLPWPSRLSERALWTSPHATWITLWVFCCARPSALWTCLPAWRPSICHCGRASRAPFSSLASWCTCWTGSTHPGYPWDLCPPQHCTIPCGSCTAPLYSKVRKQWNRGIGDQERAILKEDCLMDFWLLGLGKNRWKCFSSLNLHVTK